MLIVGDIFDEEIGCTTRFFHSLASEDNDNERGGRERAWALGKEGWRFGRKEGDRRKTN